MTGGRYSEIGTELRGIADALRDCMTPANHRDQIQRLQNQIAEQQADIDQLRQALAEADE